MEILDFGSYASSPLLLCSVKRSTVPGIQKVSNSITLRFCPEHLHLIIANRLSFIVSQQNPSETKHACVVLKNTSHKQYFLMCSEDETRIYLTELIIQHYSSSFSTFQDHYMFSCHAPGQRKRQHLVLSYKYIILTGFITSPTLFLTLN